MLTMAVISTVLIILTMINFLGTEMKQSNSTNDTIAIFIVGGILYTPPLVTIWLLYGNLP